MIEIATTNKNLIGQIEKKHKVSLRFYHLSTYGFWCEIKDKERKLMQKIINVYDEDVGTIEDKKFFMRQFLEEAIYDYLKQEG